MDVLSSVAGSAAWVAAGAIAAWLLAAVRKYSKRGHIANLIRKHTRVQIVCSSVHYPDNEGSIRGWFLARTPGRHGKFMRAQPRNVLFSPVAEGAAIARLYLAFHESARWRNKLTRRPLRVDIASDQTFSPMDARDPFICVGGPSVNAVSDQLIRDCIPPPQFDIQYPGHEVRIADAAWRVPRTQDKRLREDFGFTLCGVTPLGTPFIVLWGTYAFGTLVATRALLDNWKKFPRGERKKFKRGEGVFLIAHGRVNRYQVIDPIQPVSPQPQVVVRDFG